MATKTSNILGLMGFGLVLAGAARKTALWRAQTWASSVFRSLVSPFFMDKKEDEWWVKERYSRVPVLGPLTSGGLAHAIDPPSDDEIMRSLERAHPVEGGFSMLHEVQRNNVHIVKEKIADYVDPPRVYPLIGPAQLHHAHYKCSIYYTEVTRIGWPLPHTLRNEDAREVIYVDHNHRLPHGGQCRHRSLGGLLVHCSGDVRIQQALRRFSSELPQGFC